MDRPVGLSVVCVFNDAAVRAECLDASLDAARARDPEQLAGPVELVAVDNVAQDFTSAGAALNHGARLAVHDVVVFVHQDVYLHSLDRLRAITAHLDPDREGPRWGMVGACGIAPDGTVVGTLRDRVELGGLDSPAPRVVDTVDEVLFCVRRDQVLAHPLSEHPELAWHAYAVEYSLRLRGLGLLTGAANAAISHNSRTVNLDRLDVAHAHVAREHPGLVPARTTCGVVGAHTAGVRGIGVVRAHAWRRRWLAESARALRAGRTVATTRPTVLADIRLDVDDLLWADDRPLQVVNVDAGGGFADHETGALRLTRGARQVLCRSVRTVEESTALLEAGAPGESWLVTNLASADVRRVTSAPAAAGVATLLGVHDRDLWLLIGPVAEQSPPAWTRRRAVPLLAGV